MSLGIPGANGPDHREVRQGQGHPNDWSVLMPRITEAQRLQDYFWQLEKLIPNPGPNWARSAKPCKYARILEERKQHLDNASEETG